MRLKSGYNIPPDEDLLKGLELTMAEGTLVPILPFPVTLLSPEIDPLRPSPIGRLSVVGAWKADYGLRTLVH